MPTTALERLALTGTSRPAPIQAPHSIADLPDFQLLSLVAQGSQTELWKVHDLRAGQLRALKILNAEFREESSARLRLRHEVDVLGKVNGDFVVRHCETRLEGPLPFILLEWLNGKTLELQIGRERRFDYHEALWLARQTVQGLHEMLVAGYVYPDLQPANIFVCHDGAVKLIGLAHATHDKSPLVEISDSSVAVSNAAPASSATKIAVRSRGVDSELFDLGRILYRMLTGEPPFSPGVATDSQQPPVVDPKRLRQLAPDVPRELADFVHTLLVRQVVRRGTGLERLVHEFIRLEIQLLAAMG